MTLLVTGGHGFVMSHVVRAWLDSRPGTRALVVDVMPRDAAADRFFAGVADRIDVLSGGVEDASTWRRLPGEITHVVHGAAITPTRGTSERERAREIVEVNVAGTLNALEWARAARGLERFVHVSTGSVYGGGGPDGPLPEDGYEMRSPDSLYPLTKRTGELLALRYAELFGLPLAVVRLASVFGPMDRVTPGRDFECIPHRLAHRALRGQPLRLAGADAIGDFVHAGDVASAIHTLLSTPDAAHALFNVGSGRATSIGELAGLVAEAVSGTRVLRVPEDEADVVGDPARRHGAWGAYDISRLRALGWSPRPLRAALADYLDWLRAEGASTC